MRATKRKIKIRQRILLAFSAVLFFSYLLTGVAVSFALRLFSVEGTLDLHVYQNVYDEASRIVGRANLASLGLIAIMFIVAVIVTYFLSNSLTRPIEKLGKFAQQIGDGDFTPSDLEFNEVELEDLNVALNKSARKLAAYDSEQKAFFQNASHELRTPLMSIQCYAEGVSFGIMEPKAACETILRETEKLSDLVTDLLYISKIDNITAAYDTIDTDIPTLIRSCAARQEAVAAKRQISFSFDFPDTAIYCNCVRELLSRAIDNLISNAVRYAKSEITLSCHKKTGHIEINVADDGDGIAPDAISHVFERFYKGDDGIHGIGLSIVKSIAEQHGGYVTAKNSNDSGAVFSMILPV